MDACFDTDLAARTIELAAIVQVPRRNWSSSCVKARFVHVLRTMRLQGAVVGRELMVSPHRRATWLSVFSPHDLHLERRRETMSFPRSERPRDASHSTERHVTALAVGARSLSYGGRTGPRKLSCGDGQIHTQRYHTGYRAGHSGHPSTFALAPAGLAATIPRQVPAGRPL